MSATRRVRPLRLLLFSLVAFPSAAFSHRLDEYLQATLVVIEPDSIRLQINLTPGVDVAEKVLAVVDADSDGELSKNEAAAYADVLNQDLMVRLDDRKMTLQLKASTFPQLAELRAGIGVIQVEFSLTSSSLSTGVHKFTLENRHLPAASVYLINAAKPKSNLVRIAEQKRNQNQSSGKIGFVIEAELSRTH